MEVKINIFNKCIWLMFNKFMDIVFLFRICMVIEKYVLFVCFCIMIGNYGGLRRKWLSGGGEVVEFNILEKYIYE